MFNFREELEQIKKATTDSYLYEAEDFLQGAINRLKQTGTKLLGGIKTFDVEISEYDDKHCYISAGCNKGISYTRSYDIETGKKVFKKIEETIKETCPDIIKIEKNHIYVCL